MDLVDIPKLKKTYRILYDVKGRFKALSVKGNEKDFKLCRV